MTMRLTTLLLLLAACGAEPVQHEVVATNGAGPAGVQVGGVPGEPERVAGDPDYVPHEQRAHEEVAHVNQPPGYGKENEPEPSDAAPAPEEHVHVTMPPGAGPDGDAEAKPRPPRAEVLPDDGEEIPDVPPLIRQEGPVVTLRGQAAGVERGQVRFTERRGSEWLIVEVNDISDGRFEVFAPANIPNPVYVSVAADLGADGPTDDDLRGALAEPITVGEQDMDLVIPMGQVPGWAKSQDPPIHQILDREAVLYAAKDR